MLARFGRVSRSRPSGRKVRCPFRRGDSWSGNSLAAASPDTIRTRSVRGLMIDRLHRPIAFHHVNRGVEDREDCPTCPVPENHTHILNIQYIIYAARDHVCVSLPCHRVGTVGAVATRDCSSLRWRLTVTASSDWSPHGRDSGVTVSGDWSPHGRDSRVMLSDEVAPPRRASHWHESNPWVRSRRDTLVSTGFVKRREVGTTIRRS